MSKAKKDEEKKTRKTLEMRYDEVSQRIMDARASNKKPDVADLQLQVELSGKMLDKRQNDVVKSMVARVKDAVKDSGLGNDEALAAITNALLPKYVNSADPSQTWNGVGTAPKWMKAHVEAGGKKDDMLNPALRA